jgi:hypothetical protein
MPLKYKQPSGQRDFFACHLCLKIRSADRFANTMMKSKRGKLGQGRGSASVYHAGSLLEYISEEHTCSLGGSVSRVGSCVRDVEFLRTLGIAPRLR